MSIENPGNGRTYEWTEQGKENDIKRSSDFENLYALLDRIGPVQGSQEEYTPDQLRDKIDRVRSGQLGLEYITSKYGLRETVDRIMKNPPVERPSYRESRSEVPQVEVPPESKIEGISQEALEQEFLEYIKSRSEAAEALTPFVDKKLVDAGLITEEQRSALLKSFSDEGKKGRERFSSIPQERQEDLQIAFEDEKYGRKQGAPSAETAPRQAVEAEPGPASIPDEQRLDEVKERLGISEPEPEAMVEEPALPERPTEEIKPDELENLYAQIDALRKKATLALYDKADWEHKDLSQQADTLQYGKLDKYFAETQVDTEEVRGLIQERAHLKSELTRTKNADQPKLKERIRGIERRVVEERNG